METIKEMRVDLEKKKKSLNKKLGLMGFIAGFFGPLFWSLALFYGQNLGVTEERIRMCDHVLNHENQ